MEGPVSGCSGKEIKDKKTSSFPPNKHLINSVAESCGVGDVGAVGGKVAGSDVGSVVAGGDDGEGGMGSSCTGGWMWDEIDVRIVAE